MKPGLRIISYNIHKGFTMGNRSLITKPMRNAIHDKEPDLVFLQEVVGQNDLHKIRHVDWHDGAQHEYFKSDDLLHGSYGQNSNYPEGHHGNAILSKSTIDFELNVDVTVFKFEPRGFLHSSMTFSHGPVHCLCVHLGLLESERKTQAELICAYIKQNIPYEAPLLVVGDFNDWRERVSPYFKKELQMQEAFLEFYGSHARSFPSIFPISRLDRIYFRNLMVKNAERLVGRPWNRLSDHIPLLVDFDFV